MRRFKLILEYDGTSYHGWQVQPGLSTIQGILQDRLAALVGSPVAVTGAGRTDAGVHALGQVASFIADTRLNAVTVRRALNAHLPSDIVVRQAEEVPQGFDACRSARARTYRYTLLRRDAPSAWLGRHTLHVPFPLDLEPMAQATKTLVGTHDFSTFRAGGCTAVTPVRAVREAAWYREDDLWHFTITANGFLHHMVRILVGTLLEVGRGKRSPADMEALLAARNRRLAGKTAPPHGLCLFHVQYDLGD
jgi:tRNA pseudouridine38-40 synthase